MRFDEAVRRLQSGLAGPLPGAVGHVHLAPQPRRDWPTGSSPAQMRHAAGLLLLIPLDSLAHVVLTVRAGTLGRHGGQISLPGGVIEPGETFEQAALREAHEEVGLSADHVAVLGALSPIDIPVSGFRLHPIVAAADRRPALSAADGEVARILEVPVDDLLSDSHLVTARRLRDGHEITVPLFRFGDDEVWGATAMILSEFLVLLGWRGPPAV